MRTFDDSDSQVTVTELGEDILDVTVQGLIHLYASEGYDLGYARGAHDLLAQYPLLIERFLLMHTNVSPEVRNLIRTFARFVESEIDAKLVDVEFSEGAGI